MTSMYSVVNSFSDLSGLSTCSLLNLPPWQSTLAGGDTLQESCIHNNLNALRALRGEIHLVI